MFSESPHYDYMVLQYGLHPIGLLSYHNTAPHIAIMHPSCQLELQRNHPSELILRVGYLNDRYSLNDRFGEISLCFMDLCSSKQL